MTEHLPAAARPGSGLHVPQHDRFRETGHRDEEEFWKQRVGLAMLANLSQGTRWAEA